MKKPERQTAPGQHLSPEDFHFYARECHTPRQFSNLLRRLQSFIPCRSVLCCCKNAKTAHVMDLDFPEKFYQWYLKSGTIHKDPLLHECLRTGECLIWTDLFRRTSSRFDPEYVSKVKEFKLEYTMAGSVQDIPDELVCYFCLTMESEKACRDHIKIFADILPALSSAIKNVHGRQPHFRKPVLTPRQKQVIQMAAEGYSRRAIGRIMGITERTVQLHMATVRRKLHAKNQAHVVALAMRHKLIG